MYICFVKSIRPKTSFGLILFTKHMYSTVCGPWSGRKSRK